MPAASSAMSSGGAVSAAEQQQPWQQARPAGTPASPAGAVHHHQQVQAAGRAPRLAQPAGQRADETIAARAPQSRRMCAWSVDRVGGVGRHRHGADRHQRGLGDRVFRAGSPRTITTRSPAARRPRAGCRAQEAASRPNSPQVMRVPGPSRKARSSRLVRPGAGQAEHHRGQVRPGRIAAPRLLPPLRPPSARGQGAELPLRLPLPAPSRPSSDANIQHQPGRLPVLAYMEQAVPPPEGPMPDATPVPIRPGRAAGLGPVRPLPGARTAPEVEADFARADAAGTRVRRRPCRQAGRRCRAPRWPPRSASTSKSRKSWAALMSYAQLLFAGDSTDAAIGRFYQSVNERVTDDQLPPAVLHAGTEPAGRRGAGGEAGRPRAGALAALAARPARVPAAPACPTSWKSCCTRRR